LLAGRRRSFAAGSPSASSGRAIGVGSGVLCLWRCGEARGLGLLLDGSTEGQGEERDGSPGRKTKAAALPRIEFERGRRGVAEAGAGKEELGAALL
jgi:hypothetical protein